MVLLSEVGQAHVTSTSYSGESGIPSPDHLQSGGGIIHDIKFIAVLIEQICIYFVNTCMNSAQLLP